MQSPQWGLKKGSQRGFPKQKFTITKKIAVKIFPQNFNHYKVVYPGHFGAKILKIDTVELAVAQNAHLKPDSAKKTSL